MERQSEYRVQAGWELVQKVQFGWILQAPHPLKRTPGWKEYEVQGNTTPARKSRVASEGTLVKPFLLRLQWRSMLQSPRCRSHRRSRHRRAGSCRAGRLLAGGSQCATSGAAQILVCRVRTSSRSFSTAAEACNMQESPRIALQSTSARQAGNAPWASH